MQKLINRYLKPKKVVSLEIVLGPQGSVTEIRAGLFGAPKNGFEVLTELQRYNSLAEVIEAFGEKDPYVISINGVGVITKSKTVAENEQIQLSQFFPNVIEQEYYFSDNYLNGRVWISVIRRDHVNHFLEELKLAKVCVIDLFVGPILVNEWSLGLLGLPMDSIQTPTFNFDVTKVGNEYSKSNLNDKEDQFLLDGEHYPNRFVMVTTAALFKLFVEKKSDQNIEVVQEGESEAFYLNAFRMLLKAAVFLLFGLVLGDYVLNEYLTDGYQSVIQNHQQIEFLKEEIRDLELELDENQGIVTTVGIKQQTHYAHYLDKVGKGLPNKIILTKMEINPIEGKIKNNKVLETNNNQILVSGLVKDETDLGDWVKMLRERNWTKEVELKGYEPYSRTQYHLFEVLLKY